MFNDMFDIIGFDPLNWGRGEQIGRTEVGDYLVDTCYTSDCGFETAIVKDGGDWIVCEYYKNSHEAKKGHKKWCEFCKTNPKEVYSVQLEQIEKF